MLGVVGALGALTLKDASERVAGNAEALTALREMIVWPRLYAKEAEVLGVAWPRGLLLYGPPGCGKTLLTKAVCEESGAALHLVSATSVFGAYVGESEKNLRKAFIVARKEAEDERTVVLFLDEIDVLCPKRLAERPHESRVVSQLLTLLDGLPLKTSSTTGHVVVVAATNRPNDMDTALRRHGRFDREIEVGLPQPQERLEILKLHVAALSLADNVNLDAVAERTHGYSGADLSAVCREAAVHAISCTQANISDQTPDVSMEDFEGALLKTAPSLTRSFEVEVPPVLWEQIGGLEDVKQKLKQAAEWPLLHREAFERLGLDPVKGILLYGPPGCCKTTLASAVATGCSAHLFSLSCAQVYSMYSGEGEGVIRETFRRARHAAPSIVFLDEMDAMAASRLEGRSGSVERRLLSTLLIEMDGLEQTNNILVIAATNRPDALDPAILRPGRLDLLVFVGPPDVTSRHKILKITTRNTPLDDSVDLSVIAERTELFSGAELMALCSEAALAALREDIRGASPVSMEHFERALQGIRPSITAENIETYKQWGTRNKK